MKVVCFWRIACEGQYHWREAARIQTIQARNRSDNIQVFTAHVARMGVCDNLINALEHFVNLQDKGNFIDVVCDGIPGVQHIEVDSRKVLVSVTLFDHHREVKEVVGFASGRNSYFAATNTHGPEELILRVGEMKGQIVFVEPIRIDPIK